MSQTENTEGITEALDIEKSMHKALEESMKPVADKMDQEIVKSLLEAPANPDAMKDASNTSHVPTDTQATAPASTARLLPGLKEIYVTDGELIPWKGRWWRVHLHESNRMVEIRMVKPTAKQEKLAKRSLRWQKQHPASLGRLKGFRSPQERSLVKSIDSPGT